MVRMNGQVSDKEQGTVEGRVGWIYWTFYDSQTLRSLKTFKKFSIQTVCRITWLIFFAGRISPREINISGLRAAIFSVKALVAVVRAYVGRSYIYSLTVKNNI